MTKKRKIVVAGVLAVVLGLVILFITRNTIGREVRMTRITYQGERTASAFLTVPFNRDRADYHYINVVVDLNQDGHFAAYKTKETTQAEWLVRNMAPRVTTTEGNNFGFQLYDAEADNRKDFASMVVLTKTPLVDWDGTAVSSLASRRLQVGQIGTDELSERVKFDPNKQGDTGPAASSQEPAADNLPVVPPGAGEGAGRGGGAGGGPAVPVAQRIEQPAADFDVFHADVPDITQGVNECVPTSAANSLLWLAKKYNFMNKMPVSDEAIIAELKHDMKWKAASGVTTDINFIPGKDAFVARHGLPLVTHRLGEKEFDLKIMDKIAKELQLGQDVEVVFEYGQYDARGTYTRQGGHMVTAVGARREGATYYLDIHDPASPGPGTLDIYKVDGTRVIDYAYQGPFVTYIRRAIAESPTEVPATSTPATVSTTPTFLPQSGESTTTVTKTLRPKTYAPSTYYDATHVAMKVLLLDGKKYPLFQFYGYNDPSVCSTSYYSSSLFGIPVYNLEYQPKDDPDPTGCGFGPTATLPVDKVILTSGEFDAIFNKIQHLRLGN